MKIERKQGLVALERGFIFLLSKYPYHARMVEPDDAERKVLLTYCP